MNNTFFVDNMVLRIYRDYTYERANIFYKKEILKEKFPWTSNEILKKYKFTNIRRELDRGSKFLLESVNSNLILDSNKALNMALYRLINTPNIKLFFPEWPINFDTVNIKSFFDFEKEFFATQIGKTTAMQSSAYFLSSFRKIAYTKFPEYQGYNTAFVALINSEKERILNSFNSITAEDCFNKINEISGIKGKFISYQIFVDWSYLNCTKYTEKDIVKSGPGCDRGIDWMINGEKLLDSQNDRIKFFDTYENFIWWFHDNLPELMKSANLDWNPKDFQHFLPVEQQNWSVMQIENSFCELSKYMKYLFNMPGRRRFFKAN